MIFLLNQETGNFYLHSVHVSNFYSQSVSSLLISVFLFFIFNPNSLFYFGLESFVYL